MNNKTITTIFFDLGQVLVKFDTDILEKGYAPFGKFKEGAIAEYVYDSYNMNRYMEGKLTSSQFYMRTCKEFRMKIKYGEFYDVWNSMFCPYPEMERVVVAIKKKYPKIKMILVSNTNEQHYDHIKEKFPVVSLLDGIIVSHEVGKQKPSPEIFNEALKLSESLPRDTFYTDDRPDLIEAARVMGMRAFQFTGHEEFCEQIAKFGIVV